MSGNKFEAVIIDDPQDVAELRRHGAIPQGVDCIVLDPADLATVGPLSVPRSGERELEHGNRITLSRNDAAASANSRIPELDPDPVDDGPLRYIVTAEVTPAQLTALRWMLAALKPRTQVAKDGIAVLNTLITNRQRVGGG